MNTFNKIGLTLIALILLTGIGFSGYYAYKYNTINKNITNNFNRDGICKFISTNYSINDRRLEIGSLAITNETNQNVSLYYPIKYLEYFYFRKYSMYPYQQFYETLVNKSFKCKVNVIQNESYFSDYKTFQDIYKFLNLNNIVSLFLYLLITISALFVIFVLTFLICICCIVKKQNYRYTILN